MQTDFLTLANTLSDDALLARLRALAHKERETSAELVAHLAVLDTRHALFAAHGYGSLFSYCTRALALSEDAACNRIECARVCRQFPCVLELLAAGRMSLTSVRLLGRHLTAENHRAVLARAENRSRREIEALVAELAPRSDAPSLVRKLPSVRPGVGNLAASQAIANPASAAQTPVSAAAPVLALSPRPAVQVLAPQRYRVQFTIGEETQQKLRRLQTLLRREIPDGDPGVLFDRAVSMLLEHVERKKLGKAMRPRPIAAIRPETDKDTAEAPLPPRGLANAVKREVWARDQGRCAYLSREGRRCDERAFLEFHHRLPYAMRGEGTVENIALRCRRHNQFEADLVFGVSNVARTYQLSPPVDCGAKT